MQQDIAVQVTNLRLKFPGESSLVFKELSFTVPRNEKVLLLGPSGCGKSTLLQVLSGMIPHSIEVPHQFDSVNYADAWGFVFQDPDTQFCMPYVDEELAFVLENLCIEREQMLPLIEQALSTVGLQLEELHTLIDTMSLGMKQRLALASALLMQPDVLFLDEPTALLDSEGTDLIWRHVKAIASDKTIIIVEHKIDHIIDWIDRVVLFSDKGVIIADGPPELVFSQHKAELIDYGIWYPDVWHDYVQGDEYKQLMEQRQVEIEQIATTTLGSSHRPPQLALHQFSGFRSGVERIRVEQAEARQGEWIGVCGANGAGKSTLLLALMQLLQTSGDYRILGEPVAHRPKRKGFKKGKRSPLIEQLAFVFQNPELQFITDTIYDELALPLRLANCSDEHIKVEVERQLAAFDLNIDSTRHPYQLSSGQKRRLSVASAIMNKQPIILLDEPTFGQDARNTFAIVACLEALRQQGTTIIMVTHDEHIMRYFCTKIWEIETGKLTEVHGDELIYSS